MSKRHPKNVTASVRARLLQLSKTQNKDFNYILTKYGLERLLFRLSCSNYATKFVLKGAMLFGYWTNLPHRTTRDVDLLSFGSPDLEQLEQIFGDICDLEVPDDGITFSGEMSKAERIKEDQEYEGARLHIQGFLGRAKIHLQIDIGFGDVITPDTEDITLPTLLDGFFSPLLRAYPRDTVVAEKLEAMVDLGLGNTRLKDFFDLLFLCENFPFEGNTLCKAVQATFSRRNTEIPSGEPIALTSAFAEDDLKQQQWKAFLKKANIVHEQRNLPEVIDALKPFLLPLLDAVHQGCHWESKWDAGGSWT